MNACHALSLTNLQLFDKDRIVWQQGYLYEWETAVYMYMYNAPPITKITNNTLKICSYITGGSLKVHKISNFRTELSFYASIQSNIYW